MSEVEPADDHGAMYPVLAQAEETSLPPPQDDPAMSRMEPLPSKPGAHSQDLPLQHQMSNESHFPQPQPASTTMQGYQNPTSQLYKVGEQPQPAPSAPPSQLYKGPQVGEQPQLAPSAPAQHLVQPTNYPMPTQYPSPYSAELPPPYPGPVSYPQYSAQGPRPASELIPQERTVVIMQPTEQEPPKRKEAIVFAVVTTVFVFILGCWWSLPFTTIGIALATMDRRKGCEGVSIGFTSFGIVFAVIGGFVLFFVILGVAFTS